MVDTIKSVVSSMGGQLNPLNSIMEILAGDIRTLPYGGQWSGVMLLPEDQVAVFSDEDLTCAFYLFEMDRHACMHVSELMVKTISISLIALRSPIHRSP